MFEELSYRFCWWTYLWVLQTVLKFVLGMLQISNSRNGTYGERTCTAPYVCTTHARDFLMRHSQAYQMTHVYSVQFRGCCNMQLDSYPVLFNRGTQSVHKLRGKCTVTKLKVE